MTKAYLYIRMSTDKQAQGDSYRRQQTRAEEFCQQNGLEIDTTLQLTDIGYSAYRGEHIETGAFGRFLGKVRSNQIERGSYLLIESHDRYSRMEPAKGLPIFLELLNSGITIAVLSEGKVFRPDSVNEMEIMMALFGLSRSHDESARKADRLQRVWEHKRSGAARQILTRLAPGWLRAKPDRSAFEIIPEHADVVRLIFELAYHAGLGSYAIAAELNRRRIKNFGRGKSGWQKSSVDKILTSRAVVGEFEPHKKRGRVRQPTGQVLEGYFPPLIEPDVFHALQHRRTARAVGGGGRVGKGMPNLFIKIARCGYCAGPMHMVDKKERGGKYLACDNARRGLRCRVVYWPYADLEASILTFVTEINVRSIASEFIHSDALAQNRRELEAAKGRLNLAEGRRARLLDLLTGPQSTDHLEQSYREADRRVAEHIAEADRLERRSLELKSENRSYAEASATISQLVASDKLAPDASGLLRHRVHAAIKEIVSSIYLWGLGTIRPPAWPKIGSPEYIQLDLPLQSMIQNTHFVEAGSREQRYFRVVFRDGNVRTVKPNLEEPTIFDLIGEQDHDPISKLQLEEMARIWGHDPSKPEELEKAFTRLREMTRSTSAQDARIYSHHGARKREREENGTA